MKHLYYCRHGLSVMNKEGLLAGRVDTPLADEGRQQAKAAGIAARKYHFDLIISSPLARALETARIIAEQIGQDPADIITNELLAERDFGKLEGTPWHPQMDLSHEPSVEPYEHIMSRALQAKEWIDTLPSDSILLVSHGAFIRAIRSLYQPDLPFADATAQMPNAEIVQMA